MCTHLTGRGSHERGGARGNEEPGGWLEMCTHTLHVGGVSGRGGGPGGGVNQGRGGRMSQGERVRGVLRDVHAHLTCRGGEREGGFQGGE